MMKKLTFTLLAMAALIAAPVAASAAPVLTYPPGKSSTGVLEIKIQNFEKLYETDGAGTKIDDNYALPKTDGAGNILPNQYLQGIFQVTAIVDGNTVVWSQGDSGQEITGYFDGFLLESLETDPLLPIFSIANFSGGFAKVFVGDFNDATPFDSAYGSANGGADEIANIGAGSGYADGELWLDLVFVGGNDPSDNSITLTSSFIPVGTTFVGGSGNGFADITGGTGQSLFVADARDPAGVGGTTGDQDLSFRTVLTTNAADTDGWAVASDDPFVGNVVPEPTSLAVWGVFGLTGLCLRRRKAAK